MQILVISIVVIMFMFNLVASILNYKQKDKPLPENVKDIFDQEKYNKWLSYSMENLRISLIESTVSLVLIISLLMLKVFGLIEVLSISIFSSQLLQLLFFMFIFLLFNLIIELPFKIYKIFVIEEKYGFNKYTKRTFINDQIKSFILFIVLGGGLVALLNILYKVFIDKYYLFILTFWLAITFITLIVFLLNTKVFIKIFNKLTPLEEGNLKDRINQLANKVGFNIQAISIMDASKRSTKFNVFFSGIGKTKEVVLFDTLVEKLDDDEILAVLAHELGHAKNKDVSRMLIQQSFIFLLYISLFVLIMNQISFFTAFGLSTNHLGFGIVLFSILLSPISTIIDVITNYLSRLAEFKADNFAAKLTHKIHIKNALIKLFKENLSNLNPHSLYVLLHYTHPKASNRLKKIDEINL